ncbi:MAG: 1-acyl-sn-glycerol-3-phosphate acyltransferase [Planctomycetes bacterium]|nr:1-acyl-sn-glycerol-3-phosphate acyltransferase [Planctomycetota bacterium]
MPGSPLGRLRALYQLPLLALWTLLWYSLAIAVELATLGRFAASHASFYGHVWGGVCLRIFGVRLELVGGERLAERAPRVLVFNHTSMLDLFICTSMMPPGATALVKKEFGSIPVLSLLWRLLGVVFVDRSHPDRAIESLRAAAERIRRERISVFVAPEGTRSPTGELLPFKKGAFHLALDLAAPIVPLVFHGAARLQAKGELAIRPGVVRVCVLEAISTAGWKREELDARVEEVRELFVRELGVAGGG